MWMTGAERMGTPLGAVEIAVSERAMRFRIVQGIYIGEFSKTHMQNETAKSPRTPRSTKKNSLGFRQIRTLRPIAIPAALRFFGTSTTWDVPLLVVASVDALPVREKGVETDALAIR